METKPGATRPISGKTRKTRDFRRLRLTIAVLILGFSLLPFLILALAAKNLSAQYVFWVLLAGGVSVIVTGTVMLSGFMARRIESGEREREALRASLAKEGKMATLGRMAASVAHEIGNPLAVIREQAAWIKDLLEEPGLRDTPQFKEIADSVERIERHVERIKGVSGRMLGYARSQPEFKDVDVNALLAETVQFLETQALMRKIDIRRDMVPNPPAVRTDPSRVQQVFLNLLDNAMDAVGENGRICLSTRLDREKGEMAVTFADSGCGIPRDKLDKVFAPFFTTKAPGEGTGLGLAIAREILETLGGRIAVESVEGLGTTFTVFLPLATP